MGRESRLPKTREFTKSQTPCTTKQEVVWQSKAATPYPPIWEPVDFLKAYIRVNTHRLRLRAKRPLQTASRIRRLQGTGGRLPCLLPRMPRAAGSIGLRGHMRDRVGRKRLPASLALSSLPSGLTHPAAKGEREWPARRTMACLTVYSTSVTGSREIKSQQSEVTRILDGKNIKYNLVDISQDNALREEMRAKSGNPKAIPPQIFNGDRYCGDYELFVEAVEQNTLHEFLKLA